MNEKIKNLVENNLFYLIMGICIGITFYSICNINNILNDIQEDLEEIEERFEEIIYSSRLETTK